MAGVHSHLRDHNTYPRDVPGWTESSNLLVFHNPDSPMLLHVFPAQDGAWFQDCKADGQPDLNFKQKAQDDLCFLLALGHGDI